MAEAIELEMGRYRLKEVVEVIVKSLEIDSDTNNNAYYCCITHLNVTLLKEGAQPHRIVAK